MRGSQSDPSTSANSADEEWYGKTGPDKDKEDIKGLQVFKYQLTLILALEAVSELI